MENMENNNAAQAVETGTQESGTQTQGKMFTQEEVNGFVQNRLAREKAGIEKKLQSEYDAKLAELNKREMQLIAKELLAESGLPKELADLAMGNSEEEIKNKINLLSKHYSKRDPEPARGFRIGAAKEIDTGYMGTPGKDPIRAAMGIK